MADKQSKFVYFTGLQLENIRSFGESQELVLASEDGAPVQWTLVVGENGVGKTTLLQCLAKMRPVRNERQKDGETRQQAADPALYQEENEIVRGLLRLGGAVKHSLKATLTSGVRLDKGGKSISITTEMTARSRDGKIRELEFHGSDLETSKLKAFQEPLVIGYGAGRHMGLSNIEEVTFQSSVESLFDSRVELYDAVDILYRLDYASLKKSSSRASKRLAALKEALATILPDVDMADDIDILGPPTHDIEGVKSGVYVRTPYGYVPFARLSLGYQTVSAWTVDIAWRLFERYPESSNPLSEPAIVLIDEIDLHLHPRWQRQIRRDLSKHFPNVQFIATAHSPLMAQTYLDANLAVVRRDDNHSIIVNDPVVVRNWRLDQIITSDLFGFESARLPEVEEKMKLRMALLNKTKRTKSEDIKLKALDQYFESLPTAERPEDDEAMAIIRRAANLYPSSPKRS